MDNSHEGGKYNSHISRHQEDLRREKNTDQKYLSITSLQTEFLNLDSISGYGRNNEREDPVKTKCTFYEVTNHYAEKKHLKKLRIREKLVQMVIRKDNELNLHFANVLDEDIYII